MERYEKDMITVVNRNHECRVLADKLSAISSRRRKKRTRSRDK